MNRIHCVMPTYRPGLTGPHRHYLENLRQALESTEAALRIKDQFIVVHDGSPPEVSTAASGLTPPNCPEVFLMGNGGTAGALNAGFEALEERCGPSLYRTWVSDDNIYEPGCFDTLAAYLDAFPDCVLVCAQFRTIGQDGQVQRRQTAHQGLNLIDNCNIGIAFLYRTDAAKKIGPYRYGMAQDWDYWLRLEEVGRVHYLPDVLASWRNHADTALHSGRVPNDSKTVQQAARQRRAAAKASS